MAVENPIRRELGLPANRATKPVKQNEPVLDMPSEQRFVEAKNPKTGAPMYLDRQSRLQVPETRERIEQIREGSLKFNPQKGWQPSSTPDALVNLRGRGKLDEAKARAKARFAASRGEAQPEQSQLSLDDLLNHQGSVEELKQKIAQFAGAQPKKLAASEKMGKAVELNHYFVQYKPTVNESKKKGLEKNKNTPSRSYGTTERMHPTGKNTKMGQVARKQSLEEFKKQPSKKLGKSDDEKRDTSAPRYDKGVHRSFAGKGRSIMGLANRGIWSHGDKAQSKKTAISQHEEVMGQIKKLPKPDLGKAISLEHYSAVQGLKQIDPSFKGKGVDARTRGRDTEHPHSFFYRANTQPEDVVAGGAKSKYSINIPDESPLYDLSLDKENHIHNAVQENNGALNMDMVHSKLKDAGYVGFYNSSHPQLSNVVALYHPQDVSSEQEMGKSRSYFDLTRKEKKDKLAREEWEKKNPNRISSEDAHKEALKDMLKPKKPVTDTSKEGMKKWSDCDDNLDPLSKLKKV
jgi:hypothetical protein